MDQGLRRAFFDDSTDADEIMNNSMKADEVEKVECECCGMSEDYTPTYIRRIREHYFGKWVCGLCSEAAKEKKRKNRMLSMEEALEVHMGICRQFNKNIRLNPKLSLAASMRDIARKSSQYRASKGSCSPAIARTYSCGPRIGVNIKQS